MEKKNEVTIMGLAKTAVRVVTSPAAFFREMPKRPGFAEPLAFMVMMGLINGTVTGALGLFDIASNHIFSTGMSIMSLILYPFIELAPTTIMSTGMAIAAMLLCPLAYAVFGFAGAGLVHAVWKALGSREPFETAYGCVAYLSAFMPITTLLMVMPYAGILICIVLLTYLYVLISKEVHGIAGTRAWVVFGLIGVMLFFIGLGADIRSQDNRKKMAGLKTTGYASLDHRSR